MRVMTRSNVERKCLKLWLGGCCGGDALEGVEGTNIIKMKIKVRPFEFF